MTQRQPERWRRHSLPLATAVSGLIGFDGMTFGVALADIREDLGGGLSGQVLVGSAFLIGMSATLVLGGSLSELARWRTFIVGLLGMAAASAVSAAAPVIGVLVGARLVGGVAAALVVPGTLSLITGAYPPGDERDRALARWTAWTSVPVIVGPPIAAGIVTANWRFAPVAVAVATLLSAGWARAVAPEGWQHSSRRMTDSTGNVLLGLGLAAAALTLVLGDVVGWTHPLVLALALAAAVLLGRFVQVETHTGQPVLPPGLVRRPAFLGIGLATAGLYSAYCAGDIVVVYMRQVEGLSATEASLLFTAVFGTLFVAAAPVRRLLGEVDPWKRVALGGLGSAVGIASLGLLAVWPSVAVLLVVAAWCGLALAVLVPAVVALAVASMGEEHADVAASVNNAVARFARVIGMVVAGGVLTLVFSLTLNDRGLPSAATQPLADLESIELDDAQRDEVEEASGNGFAAAMLTLGGLAAAGAAVAAVTARRHGLDVSEHRLPCDRDGIVPAVREAVPAEA